MHPWSHLAVSWLVGHRLPEKRDRLLVTWAGVAPDVDGLSALAGEEAYGRYHHVLTHGIVSALVIAGVAAALGRRRGAVFGLALLSVHVHLLVDLLGSGREWPISYLFPLSRWELFTPYGWPLASWQNMVLTMLFFAAIGRAGVKHGRTFCEAFLPAKVEAAIVGALKARFSRAS